MSIFISICERYAHDGFIITRLQKLWKDFCAKESLSGKTYKQETFFNLSLTIFNTLKGVLNLHISLNWY